MVDESPGCRRYPLSEASVCSKMGEVAKAGRTVIYVA